MWSPDATKTNRLEELYDDDLRRLLLSLATTKNVTDFGNPNWVAYQTIVRTEVRRLTRIWVQTMILPAITMTLYFIIFGSPAGSRVGEMGGFNYMAYIVPGLIMIV